MNLIIIGLVMGIVYCVYRVVDNILTRHPENDYVYFEQHWPGNQPAEKKSTDDNPI